MEKKIKILFVGVNPLQQVAISESESLSSVAHDLGFEIVSSLADEPTILLCVDFRTRDLRTIRSAAEAGITTVLIASEPSVVIPQHSKLAVLNEFDRVLHVGRPESIPMLYWPQKWVDASSSAVRLNRAVMVNADKWSFVEGHLYWLRAAIAARSPLVDVFGHGWDRGVWIRFAHRVYECWRTLKSRTIPRLDFSRFALSRPTNYKGTTANKISAMSSYKVAVVIENSCEAVTEKLFDAWFSGCIPVYVGPPLEQFGLPDSMFVRCGTISVEALDEAIRTALSLDRESFFEPINLFLKSDASEVWRTANALDAILRAATARDT